MNAHSNANNNNTASGMLMKHLNIYIPRIKSSYSVEDVTEMLARRCGVVKHVDFVAIKDKQPSPAQTPAQTHTQTMYCSAFVSFAFWHNQAIMNEIDTIGSYKMVWQTVASNLNEYWILLPSKNPLPRTKLNIHQLAAYTEEMQTTIMAQQKTIDAQREQMDQMLEYQKIMFRILVQKGEISDNSSMPSGMWSCVHCGQELDTRKQLHFHLEACKECDKECDKGCDKECDSDGDSSDGKKVRVEHSRDLCGNA